MARQKQRQRRLSVVIPTRDEAANVPLLHQRLEAALKAIDHEVVVVDDSTDGTTRAALKAIVATDAGWRVIEREPQERTGLSTAVVAGIAATHGKAVCVMDGDLQHPPEVIPNLLKVVEDGADIAVASRYASGGRRTGLAGLIRRWGSRFATHLTQLVFPETARTTDPMSGFFCYRREAVTGLELRPVGFKVLVELLVCAPEHVVADVPFTFERRELGESKANARQAVLYLRHLLSLFVYVPGSGRPLKFLLVTVAGLLLFLAPLAILLRSGASPLVAWLAAALVGLAAQAVLRRAFTLRELTFRGSVGERNAFQPSALISLIGALSVLAILLAPDTFDPLAVAAVAWCLAMLGALQLSRLANPGARKAVSADTETALDRLGRRLGAEHAYWAAQAPQNGHSPSKLVTPAIARQTAVRGLPVLLVESPSSRHQRRINLERESALVVPVPGANGRGAPVAILTRRGRTAFTYADLELAVRWLSDPGAKHSAPLDINDIGRAATSSVRWARAKFPTAWRFLTVGAAGIGVNQVLIWLFVDGLGIHYLLGAALASQGSTAFNFAWLEGWVFRGRTTRRGRVLRFIAYDLVNSGSLAVRLPVMFVLTGGLHIHYLVSNVIALVLSTLVRFVMADGVIWTRQSARSAQASGANAVWRTSYRYDVDGLISIESEAVLPELAFFSSSNENGNGHASAEPDLLVQIDRVGGLALRRSATVTRDGESITYRQHLGSLIANFRVDLGRPLRVLASPGLALSPHVLYTNVVEPLLRFLFIRRQRILLHAACIEVSGTGVLVSARTDTGKTSTILRVLSRNEGQFLSDDMTIISGEGVASRYPKPLTISAHTLSAVPANRLDFGQRTALALQSRVHSRGGRNFAHFLGRLNVPFMAINAGVQFVVPPPKYAINELLACPIGAQVTPSYLFLIERGAPKIVEEVSLGEAVEELLQNSDDAYGFPPYTEVAPRLELDGHDYANMLIAERAILSSALQNVVCVRMRTDAFDWPDLIETYVKSARLELVEGTA